MRFLIALYPRRWRHRYGVELEQLVTELDADHSRSRVGLVAGLMTTAAIERIRQPGVRVAATVIVILAVGTTIAVLATQSSGPSSRAAAALMRERRELHVQLDTPRLQATTLCSTVKPGTRFHAIELDPKDGAIVPGTRVHAIELDPKDGTIVARVVLACGSDHAYG